MIDSPAQARRLIDEMCSPRIKIVLDPTNLFEQAGTEARCAWIAGAVDLLADRIMLAHAKDRAANGAFTTPGQGVIDFVHFFGCLRHGVCWPGCDAWASRGRSAGCRPISDGCLG